MNVASEGTGMLLVVAIVMLAVIAGLQALALLRGRSRRGNEKKSSERDE